ncbi:hypothetical protein K0B96_07760 [Horticoccus luteus]|uniref:Uncharacterized protein n=1 Tax=Horticoccus luteus TaxID=2862869 RepID=A0A8F9TZR0_9BACT|nr:hypothetical protein [Horticoccus luteus]QYM80492.1 hypothetical protein K0B96_07760 [Horticoccus luteus]
MSSATVSSTPKCSLHLAPLIATVVGTLDRWSRWRFIATSVLVSLGLSLFFFSPKLWLMDTPLPGTFEWDRALTFLHQCGAPFATDVEPAMRWRLLPPLIAHALGLTGYGAFVIPYVGLIALLAYWCAAAERLVGDRLFAGLLTILLATTGAVLSITSVFGLNDAWFLVGLLAVAAGRRWPSLILPGLLAPWVDERFLLGWAAALFCRWWLQDRPSRFGAQLAIALAAILPYVLARVGYTLLVGDRGSAHFVASALAIVPIYLPYGRLGWWMGFRAAWPLLLLAGYDWWHCGGRYSVVVGAGTTLAGWLAVTLLAADLSRSTNLLLPILLCGAVTLHRLNVSSVARYYWLAGLVVANLVIPYETVIYNKTSLFWSLPVELLRLFKNHH